MANRCEWERTLSVGKCQERRAWLRGRASTELEAPRAVSATIELEDSTPQKYINIKHQVSGFEEREMSCGPSFTNVDGCTVEFANNSQ